LVLADNYEYFIGILKFIVLQAFFVITTVKLPYFTRKLIAYEIEPFPLATGEDGFLYQGSFYVIVQTVRARRSG
jgi:hypothetical protein